MTTTGDIRRWAMALPEVEETSHFHVPVFKIRGRTFLGLGKDRDAPDWVNRMATDTRPVDDIAAKILGLAGWPG